MAAAVVFNPLTISAAVSSQEFIHEETLNFDRLTAAGAVEKWVGLGLSMENPLRFEMFFTPPSDHTKSAISETDQAFRQRAHRLMMYFLTALSLPDDDIWVNLSPFSKEPLMGSALKGTLLGDVMLEQDWRLKQAVAWAMHPHRPSGERYWSSLHAQAPFVTMANGEAHSFLDKIWIESDKAQIDFDGENVWIHQARLRVVLRDSQKETSLWAQGFERYILPQLNEWINTSPVFQDIRDVHKAVIFATWFKSYLKGSFWCQVWEGGGPRQGMQTDNPTRTGQIYQRYRRSFQQKEYQIVRIEQGPVGSRRVLRRYAAGGTPPNLGVGPVETLWRRRMLAGLIAVSIFVLPAPPGVYGHTPQMVFSSGKAETAPSYDDPSFDMEYPFKTRIEHLFWDKRVVRIRAMMALMDWWLQNNQEETDSDILRQQWRPYAAAVLWGTSSQEQTTRERLQDQEEMLDMMEAIYNSLEDYCISLTSCHGTFESRNSWKRQRLIEVAQRLTDIYSLALHDSRIFPDRSDWMQAHELLPEFLNFLIQHDERIFLTVNVGERWDEIFFGLLLRYGEEWPEHFNVLLGRPSVLLAFIIQYYDLLQRSMERLGRFDITKDVLNKALSVWWEDSSKVMQFDSHKIWLRIVFSELWTLVQLNGLSEAERSEAENLLFEAVRLLVGESFFSLMKQWLEPDETGITSVAAEQQEGGGLHADFEAFRHELLKKGFLIIWDERDGNSAKKNTLISTAYAVQQVRQVVMDGEVFDIVLLRRLDTLNVSSITPAEIDVFHRTIFVFLPELLSTFHAAMEGRFANLDAFIRQIVIHELTHALYIKRLREPEIYKNVWQKILISLGWISPPTPLKNSKVWAEAAAYLSMAVYHPDLELALRYWIRLAMDPQLGDRHAQAIHLVLASVFDMTPGEVQAFFTAEHRKEVENKLNAFLRRPDAREKILQVWGRLFPRLKEETMPSIPNFTVTQVDTWRRPRRRRSRRFDPGGVDLSSVTVTVAEHRITVPTVDQVAAQRLRQSGVHPIVLDVFVVSP